MEHPIKWYTHQKCTTDKMVQATKWYTGQDGTLDKQVHWTKWHKSKRAQPIKGGDFGQLPHLEGGVECTSYSEVLL